MAKTRLLIIGILISALTVLCWSRGLVYTDEASLWGDAAKRSPLKPRVLNNYGHGLKESFRLEEAAHEFEMAIALQPDYADALNNLATVYNSIGRRSEMPGLLQRALAADPNHVSARFNLAMYYYETGHFLEALGEYTLILDHHPYSKEAAFSQSMTRLIQQQLARPL